MCICTEIRLSAQKSRVCAYLEVDNDEENCNGSHQVHQVGQVLSVEGLTQTSYFVGPGGEKVEESNNGSFKLGSFSGVDSSRRKGFPYDRLADVGCDKQRDTEMEYISIYRPLITTNFKCQKQDLAEEKNKT